MRFQENYFKFYFQIVAPYLSLSLFYKQRCALIVFVTGSFNRIELVHRTWASKA